MPKGKIYKKFAGLINRLAKQYNAPPFQPHVTLLGGIEQPEEKIIRKTAQLVSGQKPFPVTFRQIDYQDYHFRALFVKAEVTKPLLSLHERAKKIFGMQNIPFYMPHLSLLYGNYPNELKEKIILEIGRDQTTRFDISSVHLVRGGEVEDWKAIKEFTFS
ncbi:2'-5' RNA ligase family protein [Candidatus Daviesbacteria bacterium]|nr:2'-5' RNA ligase family protein [Candidatus Daviesbacteria bacterium]